MFSSQFSVILVLVVETTNMELFFNLKLIILKIALLLIIPNLTSNVIGDGLIEVFRWKQMDFYNRGSHQQIERNGNIIFPDQVPSRSPYKKRNRRAPTVMTSRDEFVASTTRWSSPNNQNTNNSSYIAYNNVPMGATHFNGRLFVTIPRRRQGVPSTLNYIDLRKDGSNPSPKLRAYPNFETNVLTPGNYDSNRLISVYRTTVDECNRLWFIDTGMLEYPGNRTQVQRPSIWIIDLNLDQVIRRFEIATDIVTTGSGLASITLDVNSKRCNRAFAYLPDLLNSQLHVYSFEQNRIWSFTHNYFNFDPLGGDFSIGGQTFRWDDGIFSATLGNYKENGYRDVYFHAMASTNEFLVSNKVLQNETNAARSHHGQDFELLGSRGTNRQSNMHEYDPRTGVIFYNEIQQNGVGCWNTNKIFSIENHDTVAQDEQRMIYPSDLTIDKDGTLWVVTNSLPIFIYSTLDANVNNFRIWKQNVFAAARNTACA